MQLKWSIASVIIITVLLIGNIYFITESNQLAEQNKVLTSQIDVTKQHNLQLIDSLTQVSGNYNIVVTNETENKRVLEFKVGSLKKVMHAHEKHIDALHNVDSIRMLFARYYPNNITTSQSGY